MLDRLFLINNFTTDSDIQGNSIKRISKNKQVNPIPNGTEVVIAPPAPLTKKFTLFVFHQAPSFHDPDELCSNNLHQNLIFVTFLFFSDLTFFQV